MKREKVCRLHLPDRGPPPCCAASAALLTATGAFAIIKSWKPETAATVQSIKQEPRFQPQPLVSQLCQQTAHFSFLTETMVTYTAKISPAMLHRSPRNDKASMVQPPFRKISEQFPAGADPSTSFPLARELRQPSFYRHRPHKDGRRASTCP